MSSLGPTPSDKVSQGFFAALMAALKGDDKLAGEILRSLAGEILDSYLKSYLTNISPSLGPTTSKTKTKKKKGGK